MEEVAEEGGKRVQFVCPVQGVAADPTTYHSLEEDKLKKRKAILKRRERHINLLTDLSSVAQ